jgi:flagellar motor switch protein FliN/FliY
MTPAGDSKMHPTLDASDLASMAGDGQNDAVERILDLPLIIHVELGHRRMRVNDLLQVAVGSVLELDTAAGAPLGIYANQTLIAQGEAVVVGERYGVRVTEIITPSERVKRLGERGGRM